MEIELKRTSLHATHLQAGAKMLDFGGYDMPIEYQGVVAEHLAVRSECGIFDVSHMGKLRLRGAEVAIELNQVLVSNVADLAVGNAQYSMLLNETGGVVDDLLVYRTTESEIWIVPNASNAQLVFDTLRALLATSVVVENLQDTHGIIAVQGPKSSEILRSLGFDVELDYMQVAGLVRSGENLDSSLLCRSGYTGELGFEVITRNENLEVLWRDLEAAGAIPAGLGARDTLRTEMGYPLHGQDISPNISPISAGLKWAIDFDSDFVGKAALLEEISAPRKFRCALKLIDRGVPRSHMAVLSDGEVVGETTSGTFSPTLKTGIALALVEEKLELGSIVEIDVRGRSLKAEVVRLPFVQSNVR